MRPGSLRGDPLPRIALFSDVDGTLLDATDRLALTPDDVARMTRHLDLILASSRTLAELATIQRRLGLVAPLIAENGAVVSFPPRWRGASTRRRDVEVLGEPASHLWSRVAQSAAAAAVRIVDQRELLPDRGRSLKRGFSVCVRDWQGPGAERFLQALRRDRLEATRSGTWITITSGPHKGTGVRTVLGRAARLGARFARAAAIGNAANDRPLLASVRERYAIRNPRRGHDPELLDLPRVIPLSSSGRRAWREALAIISRGGPS
jgi:mannosyl-3-phosphoglycerate phosphatase